LIRIGITHKIDLDNGTGDVCFTDAERIEGQFRGAGEGEKEA
jgi:hypothetical protein